MRAGGKISLAGLGFKRFYWGFLMRSGILVAGCVFALFAVGASAESAPTCADLKLVPAPRECKAVTSIAVGSEGIRVVSERKTEDEFALRISPKILYGRGTPEAKRMLRRVEWSRFVWSG